VSSTGPGAAAANEPAAQRRWGPCAAGERPDPV